MNILFITSSRIGDAVLSTGLLDHIARTYPEARVTIVCGPLCVSLFEAYPKLARIIPLKKQRWNGHWIALCKEVAWRRWDMIVDLRNSAVSRLVPARQKFIFGRSIDQSLHKVQQNAAVMGLSDVPAPRLWVTEGQKAAARAYISEGSPVLGVGPTANWRAKTWPAERFVEIVRWMTAAGGVMPGARVAVFAAPGEEKDAYQVLNCVPEGQRIDMIAKVDPGTAAAALGLCDFYIGNDSGLMHCAAAMGVKTLGLFGPSWPQLYRPWVDHAAYVATPENFDELTAYKGYEARTAPCLMESLTVEMVQEAILKTSSRP